MRSPAVGGEGHRERSRAEKIFQGLLRREELTHSVSPVSQVRRHGDGDPLPSAQAQQGFVHTLDHVAQADVSVVGAVPLVADKQTRESVSASRFYFLLEQVIKSFGRIDCVAVTVCCKIQAAFITFEESKTVICRCFR